MSGESCRVCEHPYRKLIEIDIYGLSGYGGLDNRNVEMKYGIGDGVLPEGELVKRHRAQGHMLPVADYRGVNLRLLLEEARTLAAQRAAKA